MDITSSVVFSSGISLPPLKTNKQKITIIISENTVLNNGKQACEKETFLPVLFHGISQVTLQVV